MKMEDILAQCIDDVKAGRSNVADCLARQPALHRQLEPLLTIALRIKEPPQVNPLNAFKARAYVQLMKEIHTETDPR